MDIVREVPLAEARPGDRVTLSDMLLHKDDPMPGPYVDDGRLCWYDGAYDVIINERITTVVVERVTPTTDQEPHGLGSVVRAVGDDLGVFVRQSAKPGTGPWQRHLDDDLEWEDEYTWSEVLEHGRGAVEVLDEGWTP